MHRNVKDETGNRYGMLTVVRRYPVTMRDGAYWICRCDCGNEVAVRGIMLRSGNNRSCGCLRDMSIAERIAHGMWNPTNERSKNWKKGDTT